MTGKSIHQATRNNLFIRSKIYGGLIDMRKLMFFNIFILSIGILPSLSFAQSPSPSDCDVYAKNYANNAQGSVVGGAARGAAGGAIFGAIIDGGDGAGKGAAIGAIAGGAKRSVQKNNTYQQAYNACMAGMVKW